MDPKKHDIIIHRGATFKLEVVSQVKEYTYDPDVNNTPGDLGRSHAENLEYHGFTYVYVDFATVYDRAELTIRKAYIKNGQPASTPLMELSLEDGDIELTDKSVIVTIHSPVTRDIDFDAGIYELLLISEEVLTPGDIAAGVDPNDIIDGLIYGKVTVLGGKDK